MKTAMQELIEDMRLELDNNLLLKLNQSRFIPFLEKEKEQIKRAFEFGIADAYNYIVDEGEEYYNQTYNQNK